MDTRTNDRATGGGAGSQGQSVSPQISPSRRPSGGDSLPARTATHRPTGPTCNQGAACPSGAPSGTASITVGTSSVAISSASCSPVDGQGRTQCEVVVSSVDGQPFTLGSIAARDPSPGSQWSADSTCAGTEPLPNQSCVVKVQASGPVGHTLTAQLVVLNAGGAEVPGTPLRLEASPAAVAGSPSSSTTP